MSRFLLDLDCVRAARQTFAANEPRDLFYRAATELVDLAARHLTSLTVAEALAVLLQTWNKAFYRFHPFNHAHYGAIERLLSDHQRLLGVLRGRSIATFCRADEDGVKDMFDGFERVLGPVGAAKCLHLLAPRFFPLWDRAIARAYGPPALKERGGNADVYCRFMAIARAQAEHLCQEDSGVVDPLKAIDEYNYCTHTKGWPPRSTPPRR